MARESPLTQLVSVSQRFMRSVSLSRDWGLDEALDGYLLTPSGQEALGRFAAALRRESTSRAWSLTGPYGSGKSAFALFAAQALCGEGDAGDQARTSLKQRAPALWSAFFQRGGPLAKGRLCPVLITGARGSLEMALAEALLRGVRECVGRPPRKFVARLEEIAGGKEVNEQTSGLVALFEEALGIVTDAEHARRGILLVIDELGKFLEHAAARPDDGDLYVMQALAEAAARAEKPFLIVTILHQSVDRYAAHVSLPRRQEWAKVQGRFEDLAFEEPTEQTIRLLATALERTGPENARRGLERQGRELAAEAWTLGYRAGSLGEREFPTLVGSCVPLHPTVTLILGPLFKRLAQNERSLFAFLTSGEPFAFQDFLAQGRWDGTAPTFRLDRLYDYVTTALGSALYSQHRGKHWAEVQSALERLRESGALEARVAKAIGLVQAVGYSAGVPTSKDFLRFALRGEADGREIDAAIAALERKSIIVYRRHADSYALWEGSDVNVEARMDEARRAVDPGRQLTSYLADLAPPVPLVARKHSHRTGTLRYFEVCYANAGNLAGLLSGNFGSADGRVIYCLPLTAEERKSMAASLKQGEHPAVMAALPGEASDLRETCVELACLHWVQHNTPELAGDATARREMRARLGAAEYALTSEIRSLFLPSTSGKCRWYYKGKDRSFASPRHLNSFLSEVCDHVYPHTPCWQNELINRRSLSSSAAAARRNLIQAMIEHQEEENLGIEGNPPELSMYESILAAFELHRSDGEEWGFRPPRRNSDPALTAVWKVIEGFLRESEQGKRPVTDLFALLRSSPYGLKDGVLPVLLAAILLYHESDVALYEEGTFVPTLATTAFERMLRSPEIFEVQYCRIAGPRALVFTKYAAMLSSATGQGGDDQPTLLKVVRPLIKFVRSLPEYVGRTEKVGAVAKAVLGVLKEARQPDQLLFADLPTACGAKSFGTRGASRPDQVEAFFGTLRAALAELQQAYPKLLGEVSQIIIGAFGLTGPLAAARGELTHRAKVVSELAVEQRLKSFLLRVLETGGDDSVWLESTAALLAAKPMRTWSDEDRARFEASLALTARTFKHFEALAFEMEQSGAPILDGDEQALRVGITLPHQPEVERVVRIPSRFAAKTGEVRQGVRKVLEAADLLGDRELSAAVLAHFVRELLTEEKPK